MGLFDFLKKKEKPKEDIPGKLLLAMPMFCNGDRYQLQLITDNLRSKWNLDLANIEGDNNSAVFTVEGEMVALAFIEAPIPKAEIESNAPYASNWPTALEESGAHTGHAIVSVMSGKKSTFERFQLFTKVLSAILETSSAIGIYQGNQTLLISRKEYIECAEVLKTNQLPINLWIYIGLPRTEGGNNVYTYGLTAFGKHEMEIVNSALTLNELYSFIANISTYVISSNVTFKNGETLGYTAEQKIRIILSKGIFVKGESFKLEM